MPDPAEQPTESQPEKAMLNPEALGPNEKQWVVQTAHRLPDGTVTPIPQALENAMLELAAIVQRIGGVASVASRQLQVTPGQVETTSVVFRWQAFAPVDQGGAPESEAPPPEAPAE